MLLWRPLPMVCGLISAFALVALHPLSFICSPNPTITLGCLVGCPTDCLSLQDEEAVKKLTVNPGTKSRLPKPVQNLIKMIFDVESMKKAMVEYEVIALDCSLCGHSLGLAVGALSWGPARRLLLPGVGVSTCSAA